MLIDVLIFSLYIYEVMIEIKEKSTVGIKINGQKYVLFR